VKVPERPEVGLVLRYAYLWTEEDAAGHLEGSKDRPVVVVLVRKDVGPSELVYVAPVTHSPPSGASAGIPISPAVKQRLGLDTEASWISATELNVFAWPGPDLRPVRRTTAAESDDVPCAYGFLPRSLFDDLRRALHRNWSAGGVRAVKRQP
jgi:hypothetical protein